MKKSTILMYAATAVLFCTNKNVQAQCSVSAGSDLTAYAGYPPLACVNITAVSTGTAPFSYAWSNGANTSSIKVCDNATTVYWVTVTDSSGCTATDSVTVNVINVGCGKDNKKVVVCHIPPGNPANAHSICISPNGVPAHLAHGCHLGDCAPPLPPPCVVNLGKDTAFCAGGSLVLDAGLGFTSHLWSDSSTGQTLTVTQTGTYWVQVSDSVRNCTTSDTIFIVVHNAPVASAVADSITDSLGCRNLSGSATGGTTPYSFFWSTGDSLPVINVCDSLTATYILTVVDSNGCSSTDSVTVVQAVTCTVNIGNDTAFCSGNNLLLDAGTGFTSYLWSDSSSSQTLAVTQTGTYWVQVSDSVRNCSATDTISVVIFNSPLASVVADSIPDSLGCRNLTGSVTGGTPPYTFIWSTGDTLPIINVCDSDTTITYTLSVIDSNGCSSAATVTVIDTGSRLGQRVSWGVIRISPNPVRNNASISFLLHETGTVTLEVYNMAGSRIALLFQGNAKEHLFYTVDYSTMNFLEGIYLVRLTKEDGRTINSKMFLLKE